VEVAQGDPLIIGTALTLSGPQAAMGLDSQYGAQVALNLRGKVLGHEVELANHDDRCSAEGGTTAASLLGDLEGLVAVIGTSCSSAATTAADILGERGILLISPSNTAPGLTAEESHEPFYVRTAPNDVTQAGAVAAWACEEAGIETAATIGDGSASADALHEAFAATFSIGCGGKITEEADVTPDRRAVDAALEAIATSNRGAPPELLYYPLAGDLGAMITRRAAAVPGLEDTLLAGIRYGEDGAQTANLVDGVYLSAPALLPAGDFYEISFLEEYRNVSAHDDPIGTYHGQSYDAVNIVLDAVVEVAIEEGGTLYIPRTELREAVYARRGYQGLAGTYTCDPSGDCASPTITVSLVEDGDLQPVWP
jgi:branched-chain amino acid transport system substrate-binding protein